MPWYFGGDKKGVGKYLLKRTDQIRSEDKVKTRKQFPLLQSRSDEDKVADASIFSCVLKPK
jgi:hypothetical protein